MGQRTLAERREVSAVRPDGAGAGALVVAIGSLVVAIVKGQEWGWVSPRILTLLLAAAALLPLIWRRSARHPAPVVEPAMLRMRSSAWRWELRCCSSGASARCCSRACCFSRRCGTSVLTAGLMLFPGPAMATAFSVPSARLGARLGYRIPGLAGAALFAAGSGWYIARTGHRPHYLSEYLPGMLIGGAGVGLIIPTLTGAGASSLPPERFATGAAVLTMGRQIGAALGIAVLVAVPGSAARTAADFHFRVADHRRGRPRCGPRARGARPAGARCG